MLAKNIELRMLTCPREPRNRPTRASDKATNRSVISHSLITNPARINSGIAIRLKLSIPPKMFVTTSRRESPDATVAAPPTRHIAT